MKHQDGLSRSRRKAGTKSLACPECQAMHKANDGRTIRSFRGRTLKRLLKHRREVHGANV